MWEENLV